MVTNHSLFPTFLLSLYPTTSNIPKTFIAAQNVEIPFLHPHITHLLSTVE